MRVAVAHDRFEGRSQQTLADQRSKISANNDCTGPVAPPPTSSGINARSEFQHP
jgi:hypothetical protein